MRIAPSALPRPAVPAAHGRPPADGSEQRSESCIDSIDESDERSVQESGPDSSVVPVAIPSGESTEDPSSHRGAECPSPCWAHWTTLGAVRGLAEFAWQTAGRLTNAGVFVCLASAAPAVLRGLAGGGATLAAGYCGYRLMVANVGTETVARKLLVAAGTAGFAAAGGSTVALGQAAPLIALAAGGLGSFIFSGTSRCREQQEPARPSPPHEHTVIRPLIFMAVSGTTLLTCVQVPSLRMLDPTRLPRRSLALLAEAAVIEIAKGTTASSLPGVDTAAMNFERRLKAAMIGLLPYALASVALNAVAGNLLRAEMGEERFDHLAATALAGALANVVKGAVNTAILRCGGALSPCNDADWSPARPGGCPGRPDPSATLARTALRFLIASARDVLYLSLVDGGMNEVAAACLAYTLYAFFAQHRELIFDIMQGDGWTEPQLRGRAAQASE